MLAIVIIDNTISIAPDLLKGALDAGNGVTMVNQLN
jgi:hypothetical protein